MTKLHKKEEKEKLLKNGENSTQIIKNLCPNGGHKKLMRFSSGYFGMKIIVNY